MNERMELVRSCYEDVLADLNETQFGVSEPEMPNTSEIIRDYKCEAAEEWEDLTVEEADAEFDRLYKLIDEEASRRALSYC